MLIADTYSSGDIVPSHLGLAYALFVVSNTVSKLDVIFQTLHFDHPIFLEIVSYFH